MESRSYGLDPVPSPEDQSKPLNISHECPSGNTDGRESEQVVYAGDPAAGWPC